MSSLQIQTPRLSLRLMVRQDLDGLMKIFGDPKVMESFHTEPFDRQQMTSWIQRNLDHQDEYGYGLFSVILRSHKVLIGDCGLEHMEIEGEIITELGYDFRSDYWNQGFATEAAIAVRDYAFEHLALPSLTSLIRVGNEASKRVSEKIGMQFMDEFSICGTQYWRFGIERSASTAQERRTSR